MKKLFYITLLILGFGFEANAQVDLDRKLVMTSAVPAKRSITGLGDITDTTNLLYVQPLVRNTLLFSTGNDNDTLKANLPLSYALSEGMGVWFRSLQNTDNELYFTIDQISYYSVTDADGPADSSCIRQGEIDLYVFNGTYFQKTFVGSKICPQGYVDVNADYCIQIQENPAAHYWHAIDKCYKDQGKLCSWGEWYYACQKTGLGLTNMTNNFEWAGSANNHASSVLIVGNGTCKTAGESNTQTSTLLNYRCCYRKK